MRKAVSWSWIVGIGMISVAAFGGTRPVSPERRSAIRKLGCVVSFTEQRLSADLGDREVSAAAGEESEFPWVAAGGGGVYGGAGGMGIMGGIMAAVENARAGTALGEMLTAELGEWDFRKMLRSTVAEVLKKEAGFDAVTVDLTGGIKKNAASLRQQEIDTVVSFHYFRFGVQAEKEGLLAARAWVWITVWDVASGKALSSASVVAGGSDNRKLLGRICPSEQKNEPAPDCAYALPGVTTSLDGFMADNARLLKQELKIAGYIATQQAVAASGLARGGEGPADARYLMRPADWPAASKAGEAGR